MLEKRLLTHEDVRSCVAEGRLLFDLIGLALFLMLRVAKMVSVTRGNTYPGTCAGDDLESIFEKADFNNVRLMVNKSHQGRHMRDSD